MKLIIPGEPIAMMRPRAVIRGKHAGVYDPQAKIKKQQKSDLVKQIKSLDVDPDGLEALYSLPLKLDIHFHVSTSLSDSRVLKNEKLWNLHYLPDKKPDIDNFIKHSLDICNEVLWKDDAQIIQLKAEEKYSETPCTIIEVHPIKIYMNDDAKKVTKIFSPKELELLQMHLCVLRDAIAQIERSDIDDKVFLIENASIELVKFANEYSFKLKKLVSR